MIAISFDVVVRASAPIWVAIPGNRRRALPVMVNTKTNRRNRNKVAKTI